MNPVPNMRKLFSRRTYKVAGVGFGIGLPIYTAFMYYIYVKYPASKYPLKAPYEPDEMFEMMRKMGAFQYVGPQGQIRPMPGKEEDDD